MSNLIVAIHKYIKIMNYTVKAVRIYLIAGNTKLEDHEREVSTYEEALKEEIRLKSLGNYNNITIRKIKKPHLV